MRDTWPVWLIGAIVFAVMIVVVVAMGQMHGDAKACRAKGGIEVSQGGSSRVCIDKHVVIQ